MFELIRKTLPYFLVIYFLVRANKKPLFLLGIPFLMFMSQSIFFENAKPFQLPGSIFYHLTFLWLCILWIVSKLIYPVKKSVIAGKKTLSTIDLLIISLILISLIGLSIAFKEYYPNTKELLDQFIIWLSLFLGYFIIKDWIAANSWEDVSDFLFSIVLVNSIAACLYILHQGLHLNVYISEEYLIETVNGQEITRTFWFMPQFLPFSIIYLLVFRNKYVILKTGLLLINILAVIITYSISTLLIAGIITFLYFLLYGLKLGNLTLVFRNIILIAIAGVAGLFILSKALPANTQYLMARFSDLSSSAYSQKDVNTLEIRFIYTQQLFSKIDPYKKILGVGPITNNQSSLVPEMKGVTSDMVWAGIIIRWGYVGLLIFILLYIISIFTTLKIFFKANDIVSNLALVFFLYLISQILEGFVSWTFLSGHGLTIGLWYFAITSTLLGYYNKNKSQLYAK
ncbi:MAG: hypothetical protein ABIN48_10000 [Ginsengibacter sp.]